MQAFDGFAMVLSWDATVLYVSETISIGLGLSQVEMIGNLIDDYLPDDDACSLRQHLLSLRHNAYCAGDGLLPLQLCVRLRCTLNRRSNRQRMRAGYKVPIVFI